jgi:hypothetical protein
VKGDKGWSYIDRLGKVILAGPFEEARPYHCGAARVKRDKVCLLDSSCLQHGDYSSGCVSMAEREEKVRPFAEAFERAAPAVPPARSGWRVDAVVAPVLFGKHEDLSAETALEQLGKERGIFYEAQWEEHAWQVIDRSGKPAPGARWSCPRGR